MNLSIKIFGILLFIYCSNCYSDTINLILKNGKKFDGELMRYDSLEMEIQIKFGKTKQFEYEEIDSCFFNMKPFGPSKLSLDSIYNELDSRVVVQETEKKKNPFYDTDVIRPKIEPPIYKKNNRKITLFENSNKNEIEKISNKMEIISLVAGFGFIIFGGYDLLNRGIYLYDLNEFNDSMKKQFGENYDPLETSLVYKLGFVVDVGLIASGISLFVLGNSEK